MIIIFYLFSAIEVRQSLQCTQAASWQRTFTEKNTYLFNCNFIVRLLNKDCYMALSYTCHSS